MQENAGKTETPKGVQPYKKAAFDDYITFCALGGMMVTDTGGIRAMPLYEFCDKWDIDEETTRRWKRGTSNFADLVRQRREEVVPLARETAAWNRLFMIGYSSIGDKRQHNDQRAAVDALKTYLGHYGKMQLPVQRQDVKVTGGFLDMMTAAASAGVIEGAIVGEPRQLEPPANG